ncbi:hypothetical protein [Undibacterium sp. TJN19]|uniref:hypothetical protein n=1 Tax=Undibacterium sp. TJN19 TaxID=3413055 RepID=UPI003BEF627C
MKINIKLPKPRNPLAVLVKQRNAGVHGALNPKRTERRQEKQRLQHALKGKLKDGDAE